jgi:hypothetical protein
MRGSATVVSICAFLLGGCAIHPLPENVTRETTYDIVQKIRCEGREAVDNIALRLVRKSTDPFTLEWADRVEAGEFSFIEGYKKYEASLKFDAYTKQMMMTYTTSAVTFDFWFDISEHNLNSAGAGFTMPVVPGLFTLDAAATANFERRSSRKFQIVNSFYELHGLSRSRCDNIAAWAGNVAYPITGKIGLQEVFETFVRLDSDVEGGLGHEHRFSDELTFTTTVGSSVTPGIVLDPVPARAFRLFRATATANNSRIDEHKVTLAVAKGSPLLSIDQARTDAKILSQTIADERRTEDFFIVPRRGFIFPLAQ